MILIYHYYYLFYLMRRKVIVKLCICVFFLCPKILWVGSTWQAKSKRKLIQHHPWGETLEVRSEGAVSEQSGTKWTTRVWRRRVGLRSSVIPAAEKFWRDDRLSGRISSWGKMGSNNILVFLKIVIRKLVQIWIYRTKELRRPNDEVALHIPRNEKLLLC